MAKFIDPEEQRKAREALRESNNRSAMRGLAGGGGDKRRQEPKVKSFSAADWAKVVERCGKVGKAMETMHLSHKLEGDLAWTSLEYQITQLVRELTGGSR